jgi:glycogen(starch) synthase
MKILYWTGLFWPNIGGVEVLSLQFIPAMQKRGYEFIVLTSQSNPNLSEKENYNDIPIYRCNFQEGIANNNIEEIKKTKIKVDEIKKDFNPDLIHLNSIDASIFFHQLSNNSEKAPTLFTVHSLPPYSINNNTFLKKMLNSAEWITTASEAMLFEVNKIISENIQHSSLIYYGLHMPGIEPAPLQFNKPRLLCLGRVVAEKGFDLAIDSFTQIAPLFPEARLVIAGDGPAKHNLEKKAEELGISHAVEFVGWVPPEKVPELINTSTIIIIPSRWEEPFGLVALQAAQMARPSIAANAGGLPEIVEHKKTGLLFEKENTRSLAKQIIFLLENPELSVQMGQTARKKASNKFGFDRFVNEYDNLYNKLILSFKKKDMLKLTN